MRSRTSRRRTRSIRQSSNVSQTASFSSDVRPHVRPHPQRSRTHRMTARPRRLAFAHWPARTPLCAATAHHAWTTSVLGSGLGTHKRNGVAKRSSTADAGWRLSCRRRRREVCDGGPSKALVSFRAYAHLLMAILTVPRWRRSTTPTPKARVRGQRQSDESSSPGTFPSPPADARSASVCVCFLSPAVIAEAP